MNLKDKTILAFDQASSMTGFGVYRNGKLIKYGVLNLKDITKSSHGEVAYDEKVENVRQFLIRCIESFNPDIVAIEDIQRQSNVKTFKDLAYLQGVLKNHMYVNNVPFVVLSPSMWRGELKIRGRKREDVKRNAQLFVKDKFDIEVTEDEADAICISIAGHNMLEKDKIEINREY